MITPVVIADTQKLGGVLKAAAYQGQWCVITSGTTDYGVGVSFVTPIAASGTEVKTKVFPIVYIPGTSEDEETYVYSATTPIPSGTLVTCLVGQGIVVEDDYLYTRLSNVFSGASYQVGDPIYLNASGYPTVAQGAGISTVVAGYFLGLEGSNVRYRTA